MRKPISVRGLSGRGRLAVLLAAAVALLAVAGCGTQSAEPEPLDQDQKSQSDQPDRSESEDNDKSDNQNQGDDEKVEVEAGGEDPFRPGEATAAEAEDFIDEYLDAQNAATKDGDFSRTESMIEECDVCSGSRSTIEEVYDRGGHVEGGLFTKPEIDTDSENDGEMGVTVVSTVSEYKVFDASGTEVDSGPAEKETYQYWVAKRGGEWKITQGKFVD